jgi:hypothetical protein
MKIPTPTAKQAQAYWLSFLGLNSREIGEEMGISQEAAQSALVQGRKKAEAVRMRVSVDISHLKAPPVKIVGSGMATAIQLAKETGVLQ